MPPKHRTNGEAAVFCNRFEYGIYAELGEQLDAEIRKFPSLDQKQFIFRCFIVPYCSVFVMDYLKKKFPTVPYFIHEPWAYVLSHSRIVREMEFQKVIKLDDFGKGCVSTKVAVAPDACRHWNQRFELWRQGIMKSLSYYISKKGVDATSPDESIARAARLGTIHRLWGAIPATELGNIIAEMRQRSKGEARTFHLHAALEKEIRWDHPKLDLWLIEIWPLVLGYDWTYWETKRVAEKKFPSLPGEIPKPLDTTEAFSNHCKMLKLKLSKTAQARGGKPKGSLRQQQSAPLPALAELALQMDGFQSPGDNKTSEAIRVAILQDGRYWRIRRNRTG